MKTYSTIPALVLAACLALNPARMDAQSTAEMLEKGIYAEETKGDLDAAISIYEKLIGDAKTTQALVAQAQLRLGQCLHKRGRINEASAAFEKLIRDYPNEKELIAKARELLPADVALAPVPWADGERLQMTLSLPGGMDVGTMEMRADLVENEGRKAWRIGRRMAGGGHMLSSVEVDPETFRPFSSYWKHTLLGTMSATFKAGEVVLQREGATGEPTTVRPEKVVYDNEQVMHMMRRLPLQVGYKSTIPVITTLGGGAVLPIGIEVPVKETVETPLGKFECFKVVLSVGQSFWVSDDEHRYLVKFDAGGALAHLTSVTQRKSGSTVPFRSEKLGVTLTAPPEWVIHPATNGTDGTIIHLLDPAANAEHLGIHLKPTDAIPAAVRQNARAWAEQDVREDVAKRFKDVKIRDASWKNYNVAGRVGVAFLADYTHQGKPRAIFGLYALGPKTSEQFMLSCGPESLDELRANLEGIIASYRVTK